MKQATSTLIGGLAILLAPATLAQIDSGPERSPLTPSVFTPHTGTPLPEISREPLPLFRPTIERVAERELTAPQRGVEGSNAPTLSLSNASIHDRLYHDVAPDGTLWVRGADFKASADANGFSFVPFLGSHVPRNFPVDFRLADVARGGQSVSLTPSAEFGRSGDRYVLDRGAVEVRYDIALHSVEQSFALQIPAGEGDLVLTLDVETDLVCTQDGAGFLFSGEHGGMSYGAAVVIDAIGRRSPVAATSTSDGMQLIVPGTFLDGATGPIVIDPLFGTITIDSFSAELLYPDMAYDAAGDEYCIVYEEHFSGVDVDVYSQSLDGLTGTPSLGRYIDQTSDDWRAPRIAAQQNDRVFMVVAVSDGAVAGQSDIVARTRSAVDATLGTAFILKGHTTAYECHQADIGGDNFLSSISYFCVVYNRDYGTDNDVVAIIVDVNGSYTGPGEVFLATVVSNNEYAPAVSKSTGNAAGANLFNIAWATTDLTTGEQRVDAAQLTYNGGPVAGTFNVQPNSAVNNFFDVEVSCLSDVVTGFSQNWLVAFDDGPSIVTDTFVALCSRDTVLSTTQLNRSEHSNIQLDQNNLVIGTHSDYFALGYQEGNEQFVTIIQAVDNEIGITERRLQLDSPDPTFLSLAVATVFEGGGPFRDGIFAWSDFASGDADILAARYLPDPALQAAGYQYCYGAENSTGDHGFIQIFGDRTTSFTHTLTMSGLPTAFGYCLASQTAGFAPGVGGSLGTLCLGGSIGRFGIYNTFGTGGVASVLIYPAAIQQPTGTVTAMAGQTWRFQSWHRDSSGGMAVSNFTNAVALPFQ